MQLTLNLKKLRTKRNAIQSLMQTEQPKKFAGDLIAAYDLFNQKIVEVKALIAQLSSPTQTEIDAVTVTFNFTKFKASNFAKKIIPDDIRGINSLINWNS
jgi:hypothetical protein